MCHDRMETDELRLTQEFISNMLGIRRAGVNSAAVGLQSEGLIRYSRGLINILKRDALEESSCECYRAIQ
jgi:CRP-like cAMP-binding protein